MGNWGRQAGRRDAPSNKMGSQVHQMDLVLAMMLSQKTTRVFLLGTFFVKFHIFQQALCDKTDEVKLLQGTTCQSTQMKKSSGTGHATIIPHFSSFSLIVNTTSGVAVFFHSYRSVLTCQSEKRERRGPDPRQQQVFHPRSDRGGRRGRLSKSAHERVRFNAKMFTIYNYCQIS